MLSSIAIIRFHKPIERWHYQHIEIYHVMIISAVRAKIVTDFSLCSVVILTSWWGMTPVKSRAALQCIINVQTLLGRSNKLCLLYLKTVKITFSEKKKISYEAWFNREFSLHHLRIFRSKCFIQILKQKQNNKKFGKRGILIGFEEIIGNYHI